jgi:hypothetical protein
MKLRRRNGDSLAVAARRVESLLPTRMHGWSYPGIDEGPCCHLAVTLAAQLQTGSVQKFASKNSQMSRARTSELIRCSGGAAHVEQPLLLCVYGR